MTQYTVPSKSVTLHWDPIVLDPSSGIPSYYGTDGVRLMNLGNRGSSDTPWARFSSSIYHSGPSSSYEKPSNAGTPLGVTIKMRNYNHPENNASFNNYIPAEWIMFYISLDRNRNNCVWYRSPGWRGNGDNHQVVTAFFDTEDREDSDFSLQLVYGWKNTDGTDSWTLSAWYYQWVFEKL